MWQLLFAIAVLAGDPGPRRLESVGARLGHQEMAYLLKTAGSRRLMMPAAIFRCHGGRS
jgi:hypothetical protein